MDNVIFEQLIAGLDEAKQILERKSTPTVRYHIREVNMRKVRESMRMNQTDFAELIGVRTKTLQLLEKGRRRPSSAIIALCRIIMADPIFVHNALAKPAVASVDGSSIEASFEVQLQQIEEFDQPQE